MKKKWKNVAYPALRTIINTLAVLGFKPCTFDMREQDDTSTSNQLVPQSQCTSTQS